MLVTTAVLSTALLPDVTTRTISPSEALEALRSLAETHPPSLPPPYLPPPPASGSQLAGSQLYDELYRTGYHSDKNLTHAAVLVRAIVNSHNVSSVLDFGCSHGYAVSTLWKHNITASGYDISQVAVKMAEARVLLAARCT